MLATNPLGRYTLEQELTPKAAKRNGRRTFLAQETQTQERVVVKVIQLAQAVHTTDQWASIKLFEREAKMLERLNHPAIPQYKDAFETTFEGIHSFVLVQTYLEAASLETLIQSGKRFEATEVMQIAERLLSILSYLHTQTPPVIHRDIKPSNILMSPPAQERSHSVKAHSNRPNSNSRDIYLIDFGSVHTDLTQESGTITIVGSYGYIPLEQFAGQATPASDLYSLGMTLLYLITGTHPADIDHVDGKVQLTHPSLSPTLARWLEKMTHPYLNQRFDSAEQALIALKAKATPKGSYQHLKPEGTEVELESVGDRICITYDKPIETAPEYTFLITASVVIYLWFTGQMVLFSLGIFTVVFHQLLGAILLRLYRRIPSVGQQTIVEIDRHQGIRTGTRNKRTQKVWWAKQTSQFQDLDLLTYNPGYRFASYQEGKNKISQSGQGVLPKLSIHSKELTYAIGHAGLSAAEFWWLGQELSSFLGLELQTIYPMPIVKIVDTTSGGCGC
ncbi:MAG: serine/threonine protein kinase [Phormidesmis sp.]